MENTTQEKDKKELKNGGVRGKKISQTLMTVFSRAESIKRGIQEQCVLQ